MILTKEQQEIVEKNHNLIYYAINKFSVPAEEYYGICAIGLCKAAGTYNSHVSRFSTYALNVILNEIRMEKRKERKQEKLHQISMDAEYTNSKDDSVTLHEILTTKMDVEDEIISFKLSDILTPEEMKIVNYLYMDYKQKEIGQVLGVCQPVVSRRIKSIKKKLMKRGIEV
nr:MAG TPA: DNA directed RNA polymerase subunit [Caudoviricetes sp.]